jgi:hypothetical protein
MAGERMYYAANTFLEIWQKTMNTSTLDFISLDTPEKREAFSEYLAKAHLFPQYLMLIGYAIENVAKGLDIVIQLNQGVKAHNLKDLIVVDHDANMCRLKHIAKHFHIKISRDEYEAAKLAIDHVIWAGKYGVPKDPKCRDSTEEMSPSVPEWQRSANVLNPLFNKIRNVLAKKTIQKGNEEKTDYGIRLYE